MSAEQLSFGDEVPAESVVIAVHLTDLNQLFNSMDPSPFHEKELDDDAEEYIVESSKELPASVPAALVVYLSAPIGLPDEAKVLGSAIRGHFARRSQHLRRQQRRLIRRGWMNLMIGVALLICSVVIGQALARRHGESPFVTVLKESLLIGGWVAMSRPMEILLYDWWLIHGERRIYGRVSRIPVRIVYLGRAPAGAPMTSDPGTAKNGDAKAVKA